jgi:hypothetical protein
MTDAYKIGTSLVGMVTLDSLGIPDPKGIYRPYTEAVNLGDGTVRGAGYPTAEWQWGFLTQTQREALRDYCAGASASVYIETTTTENSDEYKDFLAVMIWPEEEERTSAMRRLEFSVQFRQMVVQTS